MRLHELGPDPGAKKARKRVARGNAGSGGTYAGRGRKGQGARSGPSKGAYFEGGQLPFVRRLPFKKGFARPSRVEYTPVNLRELENRFEAGATVTAQSLVEAGLLRQLDEPYKVLAAGQLTKSLTVHAPRFSDGARERIQAAGGSCVDLEDTYAPPGGGRPHPRK